MSDHEWRLFRDQDWGYGCCMCGKTATLFLAPVAIDIAEMRAQVASDEYFFCDEHEAAAETLRVGMPANQALGEVENVATRLKDDPAAQDRWWDSLSEFKLKFFIALFDNGIQVGDRVLVINPLMLSVGNLSVEARRLVSRLVLHRFPESIRQTT